MTSYGSGNKIVTQSLFLRHHRMNLNNNLFDVTLSLSAFNFPPLHFFLLSLGLVAAQTQTFNISGTKEYYRIPGDFVRGFD
jgi:hypothetical protein